MNIVKRITEFTTKTFKVTKDVVFSFVRGIYTHAESITILCFASLGLNYLLSELPFYITLPTIIESAMVIPVLSVGIICFLIWMSQVRLDHRQAPVAVA